MPLYTYHCAKCDEVFEVSQKISDPAWKTHRGGCGGKVERRIGSTAFVLKGSGWYKTDYAAKTSDSKAGTGKDGDKKADAPKGDAAKADSSAPATPKSDKAKSEKAA